MSNTDRDAMLERWAIGMEKLEQYYEGLYGPPRTPATLPSVTNCNGMLEAIADGMEQAKRNINKKSPTYHSDSVAYSKTVPAGDVHHASLEQIGGKTVVWNQIADLMYKDGSTYDVSDITYTFSTNGKSVFADGTATAVANRIVVNFKIVDDHKYLLRGCPNGGSNSTYCLLVSYQTDSFDYGEGSIFTAKVTSTAPANRTVIARVFAGSIVDNIEYTPQLFDLTLMFGAGNEPSTVAEFQQMFPADWYPYNAGALLSAGVTEIVSKDSNNTTIDTYPIPASVQALTGYGWNVGDVYNYVDFERKKFVQNVGSVDLGTLTWGYGPSVGWSATLPNVKNPADNDTAFNGLSATLKVTDRNTQAAAFDGGTDAGMVSVAGGKVYVGTGSISITPSGTLIYELDNPVETDISAYLTDDNLIEVEAGGTLTFPNSNGDEYRIPVPSTETFWVGES